MLVISIGASAQVGDFSLNGKVGYQSEIKRFGIEVGGRYEIVQNLRLAPAVSFWFPKHELLGFNVDINALYKFPIAQSTLDIYPLAGINMSNNRANKHVKSTDFGFNLGAGLDYYLTSSDYLNFEFKYTFGGGDFATIMVGYGYKF